jgi:hypothetical protein
VTDTDYEPCCPKFDPTGWKDAMLEWQDRRFIKGTVKTFMLMPVNYGKVVKELEQKIKAADKVDSRGMTTKKMFMWYTTCPKCATFYGENYVVAVAEV